MSLQIFTKQHLIHTIQKSLPNYENQPIDAILADMMTPISDTDIPQDKIIDALNSYTGHNYPGVLGALDDCQRYIDTINNNTIDFDTPSYNPYKVASTLTYLMTRYYLHNIYLHSNLSDKTILNDSNMNVLSDQLNRVLKNRYLDFNRI